jgi:hypothetical protein
MLPSYTLFRVYLNDLCPIRSHVDPEVEYIYNSTFFLISCLDIFMWLKYSSDLINHVKDNRFPS